MADPETIVRLFADNEPLGSEGYDGEFHVCTTCEASEGPTMKQEEAGILRLDLVHAEDCVWRLAREWVDANPKEKEG
jgi:hypothetical protein